MRTNETNRVTHPEGALGSGTIEMRAPWVTDRRLDQRGERQRFTSETLRLYMRRSPKVAEVLPIL